MLKFEVDVDEEEMLAAMSAPCLTCALTATWPQILPQGEAQLTRPNGPKFYFEAR